MALDKKYKPTKKDFIPVYGLVKYIDRTMPAKINNELNFIDNLKVEAIGCGLALYNMAAIGAATIGVMAATLGIEKLLK
jgi:hypothetical protein